MKSNNETKHINRNDLTDETVRYIEKKIEDLKDNIDMMEWCLSGKSDNFLFYIRDLQTNVSSILWKLGKDENKT